VSLGQAPLPHPGNILVRLRTASTTIGLGNSATGTLNLDAAELFQRRRAVHDGDTAVGSGAVNLRAWTGPKVMMFCRGAHHLAGALNGGANDFSLISRAPRRFYWRHAIAQNITLTATRCRWRGSHRPRHHW